MQILWEKTKGKKNLKVNRKKGSNVSAVVIERHQDVRRNLLQSRERQIH